MNVCKFRMLYLTSDKHPVRRVDVSVLFAEKLAGRGHKIDFLLQSEGDCDVTHETTWKDCRTIVGKTDNGTSRFSRVRKHLYSLLVDLNAFRLVSKERYDFVQLKDKYLSALYLVPLCRIRGVKFLYWLSYPFPEESFLKAQSPGASYPFFYRLRGIVFDVIFYRFIAKHAEFIFVQSEQMKRDLIERGVPAEKQLPVPMGVSVSQINDIEINADEQSEAYTVVYLGILARVRKMDFVIRVFSQVIQQVPQARLQMVGGGDDEFDMILLHDEVKRLGLEGKVEFTGWLPMNEALEYVKEAAVCLSPFYPTPILNSTSPTKLVEYMALGKAVVANDHPEQRKIIEESGAGLCVPYDEKAFADAIVKLLNDPDGRREMGRKGRDYVEEHRSYDRIADIVEAQYLKLLDQQVGE